MLMDALERSVQTDVYHERDPRAFVNYQLREMDVLYSLVNKSGARTVVLKCLMESQRMVGLLGEFPGSTGVWMFRHHQDVVNSMLRSFNNQAAQVRRIAQDRDSDGWLGENMSDETHALVKELARGSLDDATGAAIQWYFRNIRFFEQNLADDPRINLMHYESLVRDPDREISWMFEKNNLSFESHITKWINARSIGKSSPPGIRADVQELCNQLYERLIAAYRESRGVL